MGMSLAYLKNRKQARKVGVGGEKECEAALRVNGYCVMGG